MKSENINNKLYRLSSRPFSEKFTDDEIVFILEHSEIKDLKAKYFIWKQKRHNGLYIGFMIDQMPYRVRRASMDNSIDVISTRELSKLELLEQAQNYGCGNRIFKVWSYGCIENLIDEDLKYNIKTPGEFVKHCKRLGYTNPNYKNGSQFKLAI